MTLSSALRGTEKKIKKRDRAQCTITMRAPVFRCAQTAGAEREGGEREQLLVVTENGSEHIQSGVQSMRQGRRKTPAHHYFHRWRSVFLAFKIQFELPVLVGFANEVSSGLIRCPLSVLLLCTRRCWASPCCVCAPSPLDASPLARTTSIFWMTSGSRGDGINSEMWVIFVVCIFNAVTFFVISCTPQPPVLLHCHPHCLWSCAPCLLVHATRHGAIEAFVTRLALAPLRQWIN